MGGFSFGGSEIRSGGRAGGRLFPGSLESPEASWAAGPRAGNFLRASLRARRMASAFSRTLFSEGFS